MPLLLCSEAQHPDSTMVRWRHRGGGVQRGAENGPRFAHREKRTVKAGLCHFGLIKYELADLHRGQVDNRRYSTDRLNVHLLLEIGLRLPGATVYHCHPLVAGDSHSVDMPAMEYRRGREMT